MDMTPRGLSAALETSCQVGGVALGMGGTLLVSEHFEPGMRHARDVAPALNRLARKQGLDLRRLEVVMVDLGPGSFTGVRVGVATVKALHLATRCQVVGVLATDAVAAAVAQPQPEVCVVIDATRGELYAARYRLTGAPRAPGEGRFTGSTGVWERVSDPSIVRPADLIPTLPPGCYVTGGGLSRYEDEFASAGLLVAPEEDRLPSVEWVYALGWERREAGLTDDPYTLEPLYLRLAAAEERWRERQGTK